MVLFSQILFLFYSLVYHHSKWTIRFLLRFLSSGKYLEVLGFRDTVHLRKWCKCLVFNMFSSYTTSQSWSTENSETIALHKTSHICDDWPAELRILLSAWSKVRLTLWISVSIPVLHCAESHIYSNYRRRSKLGNSSISQSLSKIKS